MKHLTSPIRLVQPSSGWLARKETIELAMPTEELAVVCQPGADSYRLVYAEDNVPLNAKPNPLVLQANELALILTRDFSLVMQAPVSFSDGFTGDVELSMSLRILRPAAGDQHPIFSRMKIPYVSDVATFKDQLIQVIRSLILPTVEVCFSKKSFLKLDWSAEELQGLLREHCRKISPTEHIGLRDVVVTRVSSEEGEGFSLQRRECLRRLEEAESQEVFDKRAREMETSKAMAESEAAVVLEIAREQRQHRLAWEKLINQGRYEEARQQMESNTAEQAEKTRHLILDSQLSEHQKRVAQEQWVRIQEAEFTARLAELEARGDLARLTVREKELEIEMKKIAGKESAARTERDIAEANRLEGEMSVLADQLAACHDFMQKLTKDFESALAATVRKKVETNSVQVCWRSFHAMETPWKAANLTVHREKLGNFEYVCTGESLQLRFEPEREGYLYILALGPYVAAGRIEYRWARLFSNRGENDLAYRFNRPQGNFVKAGESLIMPVAGGSSDLSESVWTFNAATGRELLYVIFTSVPLTEAQLDQITRNPGPRFYTTRGFESHAHRRDEDRETASWQTVSEDYRAEVLDKLKSVAGDAAFISESVFYHVR